MIYYVQPAQPPNPLPASAPTSEAHMMLPQLRNALVRESSTLESSIEMQGCLYVRNSEWHGDAAVELGPDLNGNNGI